VHGRAVDVLKRNLELVHGVVAVSVDGGLAARHRPDDQAKLHGSVAAPCC